MSELGSFVLNQEETFRRARLPSLYSDFHVQRNSNPDGFAANYTAWIVALSNAAWTGVLPGPGTRNDILSITTGEDLLRALEIKDYGRPLALGAVIDEAISKRRLIPFDEFMGAAKSIYSRKWKIQPWWLLSWGLGQFGIFDSADTHTSMPVGRFVIVDSLENAAKLIVACMGRESSRMNRTYPMSLFKQEAAKALAIKGDLTNGDLNIVLKYLARDKGLVAYDSQTVVFRSDDDVMPYLSSQDVTVASLKALTAELREQIDLLLARIAISSQRAKKGVADKNRVAAVAALKSKKLFEQTLEQRVETMSQLEGVYNKIEQATDQLAMVRVMSASTVVLRNLYNSIGGIETVDNIVEQLRNETQKVDEVSNSMQTLGQDTTIIDDHALDQEFEDMLREARSRKNEQKASDGQHSLDELMQLPNVPKKEPKERETTFATHNPPESAEDVSNALKRISLDGGQRSTGEFIHEVRPKPPQYPEVAP